MLYFKIRVKLTPCASHRDPANELSNGSHEVQRAVVSCRLLESHSLDRAEMKYNITAVVIVVVAVKAVIGAVNVIANTFLLSKLS